jgi:hypothetical protein
VWVVISVAAVVRRLFALAHPSQGAPPSLAELDAFFASHVTLTLAHILPALAFVVLVPFVIFRASAGTNWPEPLLYPLGVVVGLTAYAMSVYIRGMGGALRRPLFQHRILVLPVSRLSLCPRWRAEFSAAMDHPGDRDPAWHRTLRAR